MVCSLVWQLMPSVFWPEAAAAVLASGAAPGTGTPSGPAGPGAGAGLRVPSVLSAPSFSSGAPPDVPALEEANLGTAASLRERLQNEHVVIAVYD